jgi:hypothetical protein
VDLLDVAILALRLALVAVLYAFLLVVVRSGAHGLHAAATPGPRTARLHLVVVEAGGSSLTPGQVVEVFDGATLGRTAEADIVVADRSISARHARFARARMSRTWMVADLGSTNGTVLNDARVAGPTPLGDGDALVLGSIRFKIETR